jgi:hypothetical protein
MLRVLKPLHICLRRFGYARPWKGSADDGRGRVFRRGFGKRRWRRSTGQKENGYANDIMQFQIQSHFSLLSPDS